MDFIKSKKTQSTMTCLSKGHARSGGDTNQTTCPSDALSGGPQPILVLSAIHSPAQNRTAQNTAARTMRLALQLLAALAFAAAKPRFFDKAEYARCAPFLGHP
jgi:hypothetical protein